jgi:uroporphyrin-III C-methyltransferase
MIYFIGAGPGDPELITRKAWRLIGTADVILHDALIDLDALKAAFPAAKWVNVGKRFGQPSVDQRFICQTIVGYARRGLQVVRLKGGDPSIFGRIAEEIAVCQQHGLDFEIVPGVTAASASAADLGVSLTMRGVSRSVVFVTPVVGRNESAETSDWLKASLAADTVVLYMASVQSKSIATALIAGGKSANTPLCVVENASRQGVRFQTTLGGLAQLGLPKMSGPVSLLLGKALAGARTPNSDQALPGLSQTVPAQQSMNERLQKEMS